MTVFLHYLTLGFQHVLPLGIDHILFITALFFLNSELKTAVIQCSLFTLAHSITLALVALGTLHLNTSFAESMIALSIFLVAIENLFETGIKPWRLVLVFIFGLMHGVGFASALKEVGILDTDFVPAIIGFNVGVEVAQIAIIAACYGVCAKWWSHKNWYRPVLVRAISLTIAGAGFFWFIERLITE